MNTGFVARNKRRIAEAVFFLLVMGLCFYTIFSGQNLSQIWSQIMLLSPAYLIGALTAAIFFVCGEGYMIFYLLRALGGKSGLLRCISYSFIGFFYSGITPSATGGQPMQLYYMRSDGNSLAGSSVVLMVVAVIYKLVLVIYGIAMLLFWRQPLRQYLQGYFALYLLGLGINVVVVAVLLAVMFRPQGMKRLIFWAESWLVKWRILRPSQQRGEKIEGFVDGYRETVYFLVGHRAKVFWVVLVTFLQRASVFFLAYLIYRGFGESGAGALTVFLLQASVYIAVDMLPIPGAQGITEVMYRQAFATVFPENLLMPALYVTRGISFYFLLIVSMGVTFGNWIYRRKMWKKVLDKGGRGVVY